MKLTWWDWTYTVEVKGDWLYIDFGGEQVTDSIKIPVDKVDELIALMKEAINV